MLLTKGFEVEMYTGTATGEVVGLSDRICQALPGFVREPDRRNVEYITPPLRRYEDLICALLQPRAQLRQFLCSLGPYTLLPGSTLALGGADHFERSDPDNPYHDYIERTYGTQVVTASIHINVGLPDTESIFRACRLLRVEAPLYLALSASSPFLDGQVTGSHSSRWQVFPKTPAQVPLFRDHAHYITWMQEQLALGTMQNVRHLWAAVRPNGPERPYHLNRAELRICDLVGDPVMILAITALIEARLLQLLADPEALDPLRGAFTPMELETLCDQNEQAAARHSLHATLIDWQKGRERVAQEWIEELLTEAWRIGQPQGFGCFLAPLQTLLKQGNEAQRWLQQVNQGSSPAQVYQQAIQELAFQEQAMLETLCQAVG
ncbi:glutamate--cysteine ligase [Thermostichus vulcanus]|uniref:Glutamate--cysteine ligase n=1 Tax=Thermostichus vulcanus str. 'Rupite' TaxID=2813851 RepID=A0ABT0CER6_THEVL|nr:glutamate--cysteine ligase [Thermostichus vulcanus str. 'Rupite']